MVGVETAHAGTAAGGCVCMAAVVVVWEAVHAGTAAEGCVCMAAVMVVW